MNYYFPSEDFKLIAPSPRTSDDPAHAVKQIKYVNGKDFLAKCEYVLMYHSSFWCYPCRSLSKILNERYKLLKQQHQDKVELILVSGDGEESEFQKSLAAISWAAVPFQYEDLRRDTLPTKMKVDNIPTIVVIRCSDGKIVNEDAVSSIAADSECRHYPWKPQSILEVLAMANLVRREEQPITNHLLDRTESSNANSFLPDSVDETNKNNNTPTGKQKTANNNNNGNDDDGVSSSSSAATVGAFDWFHRQTSFGASSLNSTSSGTSGGTISIPYVDAIKGKRFLGLVFSSRWCVPCEAFMTLLYTIYRKVNDRSYNALEIILVPGDRDRAAYDEYLQKFVPFYTLPFNDPRISILTQMFSVTTIPMLVMVDPVSGEIINASAREDVCCDPEGRDCPWAPRPAPLLSPFEPTNECVEIFVNHPTVLLNLFAVEIPTEANAIIARFRDAISEFRKSDPQSNLQFLVTKNREELLHNDYRTCLKGHFLVRAEQPMECTCEVCGKEICDDISEKESDSVNINHFCCKICGYDVCFDCWNAKKAGKPKDAEFWEALTGDLGIDLTQVPSKQNRRSLSGAYLTKFTLSEGKSVVMDPAVFDDKEKLKKFF